MKLNLIFKTLIDIAFFLLIPVVIFFPGTVLYMVFFPQQTIINHNIPFTDDGLTFASILYLIVFFIEFVLFFLGFYNLKKLAALTLKKTLFKKETVNRLQKIGQFFSICGGSSLVLLLFFKVATLSISQEMSITFGFSKTLLLLFLFIIGIFFLMLSNSFEKAMAYKTENDLTI